jgi:CelD/BcsL family acetyltransferase involved in cellulose biosynthesis
VALLLGTGITDYLDVLLETQTGEAGELLRSALARTAGEWDLCDFQSLPSNSPLLASTVRGKARVDVRQQDVCPVLSLPARAEELPGPISRHQWENYRYYRRRAERRAHLQVQTANEETVGDCLDVLLQLHRARWTERGCPGVLADERVESFHKEAAAGLQALGVLRLYVLRLNGRPAAALYACLWKRRFYYYVGGFDPSFRQVSPGTLLIGHAVQEAVREGADIFDFLRGQESYKYLWNARDTFTYRLQIRPTA